MLLKQAQKPINIHTLDLKHKSSMDLILNKDLGQKQLKTILNKVKSLLLEQNQPQVLIHLNDFKLELKSKYSISLSKQIIQEFIKTREYVNTEKEELNFDQIEKEIRISHEQINKRKYCFNNDQQNECLSKKLFAQKRKRKNIMGNSVSMITNLKTMKNFDQMFIKQKLIILKEYIEQQELAKFEAELVKKVNSIPDTYGRYSEKIRHYTIFDTILQKIFILIQEDTKNIQIRTKYQNLYKKMKEEMVSIITNEDDVKEVIKKSKTPKNEFGTHKTMNKLQMKRNYYIFEKEKQELTSQIQQTLQGAKKHIKEAFLKRGRPDFAYQMELALGNRKTPFMVKKLRT